MPLILVFFFWDDYLLIIGKSLDLTFKPPHQDDKKFFMPFHPKRIQFLLLSFHIFSLHSSVYIWSNLVNLTLKHPRIMRSSLKSFSCAIKTFSYWVEIIYGNQKEKNRQTQMLMIRCANNAIGCIINRGWCWWKPLANIIEPVLNFIFLVFSRDYRQPDDKWMSCLVCF